MKPMFWKIHYRSYAWFYLEWDHCSIMPEVFFLLFIKNNCDVMIVMILSKKRKENRELFVLGFWQKYFGLQTFLSFI